MTCLFKSLIVTGMKKPVLAIDFDDTVNDFNHAFLHYNQQEHDALITYEDILTYNYQIDYSISEDEQHHRIWDFCHNHHNTVTPMSDALTALNTLAVQYELHLVTSRCESMTTLTHEWLDVHIPNIFTGAHFTNGFATKHPERRRTKLEVCQALDAKILIDDAIPHATSLAGAGTPVIMFDRPWNQVDVPALVTRVFSWPETLEQIEKLKLL